MCLCRPAALSGGQALQRGLGRTASLEQSLAYNGSCVPLAGEPGWEVPARQAPAAPDTRQLRLTHGLGQLLEGRAPRPRRHPRGAAPPATAGEHLATPQGAAPPAAAAVRLPAGRPAGERGASLWGCLVLGGPVGTCVLTVGGPMCSPAGERGGLLVGAPGAGRAHGYGCPNSGGAHVQSSR